MRILDRLLLAIVALIMVAMGVMVAVAAWDIVHWKDISAAIGGWLAQGWTTKLAGSVIALAVLAVGLRLLLSGAFYRGPRTAHIFRADDGNVEITIAALEGIVAREARTFEAAREVHSRVHCVHGKLHVAIEMLTTPGAILPELGDSMKQKIKTSVEQLAGVNVERVTLLIKDANSQNDVRRIE